MHPPVRSRAYRNYALALMTTVYTVNLLDRQLMGLLLQPIKEDLQLSDTQLGFVTGIAFGLFYATLGVPIARWADRGNRVTITSLAIGVWGLTVMACLAVTNFAQLVLARMAAAVGESGCKPPTYSLVGDYFPQAAERTRAMSFYWMAGPLAGLIGYVAGGWLDERYGWRMTFFLMGLPGLALAGIVKLTLIEPRAQAKGARIEVAPLPRMKEVLAVLWQQRSCRNLTIALVLVFTMLFGVSPWSLVYMMRSHGMGSGELGAWWGVLSAIAGVSGTFLGGYVASRWLAGKERAQMQLSAVTIASTVVFYVAFLLATDKHVALILLSLWFLALNMFVAPTYALLQRLVADNMRATTMATIMLLYNLIGMGAGPQIVGLLSDGLRPLLGTDSLRYAMFTVVLIMFWAARQFWQVGGSLQEDLAGVQERMPIARSVPARSA